MLHIFGHVFHVIYVMSDDAIKLLLQSRGASFILKGNLDFFFFFIDKEEDIARVHFLFFQQFVFLVQFLTINLLVTVLPKGLN